MLGKWVSLSSTWKELDYPCYLSVEKYRYVLCFQKLFKCDKGQYFFLLYGVLPVMLYRWALSRQRDYIQHYSDVTMSAMAYQITGVSMVNSTVCSDADQRKHQSSASLPFVRVIHRWPVNSPHEGPVTREMFPFDDVIMRLCYLGCFLQGWSLHESLGLYRFVKMQSAGVGSQMCY